MILMFECFIDKFSFSLLILYIFSNKQTKQNLGKILNPNNLFNKFIIIYLQLVGLNPLKLTVMYCKLNYVFMQFCYFLFEKYYKLHCIQ